MNKSKGFTLIELLVVIAIIGLIASIVIVAVQGPRKDAREAKRKGDIRNIATAQELCYGDSACGAANAYVTSSGPEATSSITGYIAVMPSDPTNTGTACTDTGRKYCWIDNTANDQEFCVYANLEDGNFYVGSHAGVFEKTTRPTTLTACEDAT